jgi:hypothetical protein
LLRKIRGSTAGTTPLAIREAAGIAVVEPLRGMAPETAGLAPGMATLGMPALVMRTVAAGMWV